jgi:hypothetical protein
LEVAKGYQREATGVTADVFDVFVANYRETIVTKLTTIYLACFSSVRDDARMWETYGKSCGGLCIGVHVLNEPPPESRQHVSYTTDVIYSRDELRSQLMTDFGAVYKLLARAKRTPSNRHEGLSALYRIAAFAAIRAKTDDWKHEAEVRHVTFSRDKDGIVPNQRISVDGNTVRDTLVLVRREGKLLSLAEVIIGCNQDEGKARADLSALLSECGYTKECAEYPTISMSGVTLSRF